MKADCCFPLRNCFVYICYPPPALSERSPSPPSVSHYCASPQQKLGAADSSCGGPRSTAFFIPKLYCHRGDTLNIYQALNHFSGLCKHLSAGRSGALCKTIIKAIKRSTLGGDAELCRLNPEEFRMSGNIRGILLSACFYSHFSCCAGEEEAEGDQ